MEYCSEGSLYKLIQKKGTIPEVYIKLILREVLNALKYLHNNKKIHRDIKPDNILVTKHGEIKIADFGVSSKLTDTNHKANSFIGTPHYMAPEIISKECYDYKVDIWSVGIMAIQMATGHLPYKDLKPVEVL